MFQPKFTEGLMVMNNLVHLSLTYDCTDEILGTLTKTRSKETLKILDVEFSSGVTDCVRAKSKTYLFNNKTSFPGGRQHCPVSKSRPTTHFPDEYHGERSCGDTETVSSD